MKVEECLETLGLFYEPTVEFKQVRKAFLIAALRTHPDKNNGREDEFLEVQKAFEVIKNATKGGQSPLSLLFGKDLNCSVSVQPQHPASYYEEAAQALPAYKVEHAKTSRGTCFVTKEPIVEGELKVGSMIAQLGDYGRWVKMENWKIPCAIQAILTVDKLCSTLDVEKVKEELLLADEIVFTGISNIDEDSLQQLAAHVSDKSKWVKWTESGSEAAGRAREKLKKNAEVEDAKSNETSDSKAALVAFDPITKRTNVLDGKSFVLTGTFACGGGVGLSAGKAYIEELIKNNGGVVKSVVSKKTNFLVASTTDAGASKVTKATSLGVPIIDSDGLNALINGDEEIESAEIQSFSAGFGGNSVALRLSHEKLVELKMAAAKKPVVNTLTDQSSKKRVQDDDDKEGDPKKGKVI